MKKPPKNRLVASGWPLMVLNSFTWVVMIEMPLIPRYPMIKHIILEIRARMNHRDNEYSSSDPIISVRLIESL